MSRKRALLRRAAAQDIEDAIEHYLGEGAGNAALGLVESWERAVKHLVRHPATGSPRYAHELNIQGLRSWRLDRFHYLVFYIERDDHIDVLRVLNGARDIPAWLAEPESHD